MAESNAPLIEGENLSPDKAVSPLNHANPATEGLQVEQEHDENPVVGTEPDSTADLAKSSSKRKTKELAETSAKSPRCSGRFKKEKSPSRNKDNEQVIEETNSSESVKEDDIAMAEEGNHAVGSSGERKLRRENDVPKLRQEKEGTIDDALSESDEAKVSYKILYEDSQRKIEALRRENQNFAKLVGNAVAKLEMYEKSSGCFIEAIHKLRFFLTTTDQFGATGAAAIIPSETITSGLPSTTIGLPPTVTGLPPTATGLPSTAKGQAARGRPRGKRGRKKHTNN